MELLPKPGPDRPLTLMELRIMETQSAQIVEIKGLVDEAMKRRLADVQGKTI
jgi:hypothetical protein